MVTGVNYMNDVMSRATFVPTNLMATARIFKEYNYAGECVQAIFISDILDSFLFCFESVRMRCAAQSRRAVIHVTAIRQFVLH